MTSGKLSPAMEQFMRIKKGHPDAILFFRMGDFYETFFEDAKTAARVLGLTLTSRSKGSEAIPMAGVPYHAVQGYVRKLIEAKYKVAICEQLEDPATAKGLVKRDVVQVVTPGTLTDEGSLERSVENFLAAVWVEGEVAGVSWVEVSTGKFVATEVGLGELRETLTRIEPRELLVGDSAIETQEGWTGEVATAMNGMITRRADWTFGRDEARRKLTGQFGTLTLEGFGCEELTAGLSAAGALMAYLHETQQTALGHIRRLERFQRERYVVLDRATRRSLELTETMRTGEAEGSLLWVLDETVTPMGARLMREWVLHPLREVGEIGRRQEAVGGLFNDGLTCEELRETLEGIYDLERICGRVACERATPRDLLGLASSLGMLPKVRGILEGLGSGLVGELREEIGEHGEMLELLRRAISPEAPTTIQEGGIFRKGYNAEIDELNDVARGGKEWLKRFQESETKRTGITSLRVGFNKVFGYYIEVTNTHREKVPTDYERKQTLVNAERYITPELKEHESRVLSADERVKELERREFVALRAKVAGEVTGILKTAHAVATADVIASLGHVASRNGYVRPTVNEGRTIRIREGRHPVLERTLTAESFIPNDTELGGEGRGLAVITGPNMAGKSTYIRQVALIVLMAQMGGFVPAAEAEIGATDRVFTRVGASDELFRGQSTFMVEMTETANIVNNATDRSLLILDEIGRGTSTFDGLSIAWAVCEYIQQRLKARTLFATHYHELTELALLYPEVVNLNVAVREWKDEVMFLHKIVDGGTDKSYGIYVARLAGLPKEVLKRAKEILGNLESNELDIHNQPKLAGGERGPGFDPDKSGTTPGRPYGAPGSGMQEVQLTFFTARKEKLAKELEGLDLDRMTPMEAMVKLREMREGLETEKK